MVDRDRWRYLVREWWPAILVFIVAALLVLLVFVPIGPTRPDATRALEFRSVAYLRQIEQVLRLYESDVGVRAESAQHLFSAGYIDPKVTRSAFLDPDDKWSYWVEFDRPKELSGTGVDAFVISYDRAMYARQRRVAACVLSGECKLWSIDEFESLLSSPVNAGRELNLPRRSDATSMRTR